MIDAGPAAETEVRLMSGSRPSQDSRTREAWIPFGGTSFFRFSIGTGRRLVVVHGGPGLGYAYLRPAMDALATHFEVVYVDQRGSGRTPVGDPSRMNLPGAVEDLQGVLDGLDILRANLIGHSYGADLVALFAARFPDRVASMVLANPGPPVTREGIEALGAAMQARSTPDDEAALDRIRRSPAFERREPQAVESYIRNLYLPFFNDPAVAASLNYALSEHGAATAVDGEESFFADLEYPRETLTALPQVTAPTLVLYAEHDPIPESFARELADRIPGARYEVLAGASHFAYLEDPGAFFSSVIRFLDDAAV